MKQPTIEEVKEYFKDALEVRCVDDEELIFKYDEKSVYQKSHRTDYYTGEYNTNCSDDYAVIWDNIDGYAEITKYKTKTDFKTITESITELLEYKNNKYGKSALNPIEIFKGKTKVGQRLDDKISRVKNSDVLRKNDIADIIGYLILVCQENGWNNFDEFKD